MIRSDSWRWGALAVLPSMATAHALPGGAPAIDAGGVVVLSLLLAAAALYGIGSTRMRHNRGSVPAQRRRTASFSAGVLALAACLLPPLDAWSAASFSAHMVQHELLMLVAAPLLVLGRPLPMFLWAFPGRPRRTLAGWTRAGPTTVIWRRLVHPTTGWVAHAAALWIWHLPALFRAALDNRLLHDLQHFSFIVTALLFWSGLWLSRSAAGRGIAVLYLFTTTVHTGVLGALITFANRPLYTPGILATPVSEALRDQQIGGLIMWVPGSMVYVAAGLVLFLGWVRSSEGTGPRRRPGGAADGRKHALTRP